MRFPIALVVAGLAACSRASSDRPADSSTGATPIADVPAASAPRTALTAMPWLLGSFRGAGAEGTVQAPFYEKYSLIGDSTLVVEGFADSTWSGKPDSTRYQLRGDSLAGAGSARYVASVVTPDSVVFSPRAGVRNGFTWRRGDDSSWVAVITPVPAGTVRTYRMVRVKR